MYMKWICIVLLTAVATIGITSCSREPDATQQPGRQTHCPVMPEQKIKPDMHVDVNGKRIYVCCPGCIVRIKAEPGKYISAMEAQGVILEDAPATGEE